MSSCATLPTGGAPCRLICGSRDGLRENLPVLTADGLVGRISSVRLTSAQVVLMGDPNCRVSALVEDPAQDIGVLNASGPLDSSLVDLSYLAGGANLKPARTSSPAAWAGFSRKAFRSEKSWTPSPLNSASPPDARVKLNADLGALEKVWVLMNPKPVKP